MQAMRRPILQLQRAGIVQAHHRPLQTSAPRFSVPDTDLEGGPAREPAKGRTGGGEPLDSSSPNAVPKPKVSNLSVPLDKSAGDNLTQEQKQEVDEHNRDFERKHDRSQPAPKDKVDKKFWSGEGH
jgi:hypothetical protein